MKAAFYRPDYQTLLTLSQAFETLGRAECLKSSAVCLRYNTAHAAQSATVS